MATEEGVAAARVGRWMQQVGAESLSDLAFYFSTFQEALDSAGRAVADAWLAARRSVQGGLASQVRAIYRAEAEASGRGASSQPGSTSAVPAPDAAPARRRGGVGRGARFERPEVDVVDPQLVQVVSTILREASRYRTSDPKKVERLVDIAQTLAAKAETATLKRAVSTWRELCEAAAKQGVPVVDLDAHAVAEVVRSSSGPARARQALLWMHKNLYLDLDLTLAKVKRSQAHGPVEVGARQAPVAPPGVLLRIDDLLTTKQGEACTGATWISAFGAWAMAVGVVRFRHLQRSIVAQVFDTHFVFLCRKGKQANQRFGFHWSLPRRTPTGLDLWPPLQRLLDLLAKKNCSLKQLVVDPVELKPISPNGMLQELQLRSILDDTVVADLTSYSFRRMGPSWAELAGLDATQGAALGNWVERSQTQALGTVHHYSAAKLRVSTRLKFVLQEALFRSDEWAAILPFEMKQHMDSQWNLTDRILQRSVQEYANPDAPLPADATAPRLKPVSFRWAAQSMKRKQAHDRARRASAAVALPVVRARKRTRDPPGLSPKSKVRPVRSDAPEPVAAVPARPAVETAAKPAAKARPRKGRAKRAGPAVAPEVPGSEEGRHVVGQPGRDATEAAAGQAASGSSGLAAVDLATAQDDLDRSRDALFNALAEQRWSRPGHAGAPEPMTEIPLLLPSGGRLFLGGLPKDPELLRRRRITLLVCAMPKDTRQAKGVPYQDGVLFVKMPIAYASKRDAAWKELRRVLWPTLAKGESLLVHCAAGVHRAPVVMALILACLTDKTFEDALAVIQKLRAIEPQRIFGEDPALRQWCSNNTARVPKVVVPPSWAWGASLNKGDAPYHVVPLTAEPATEPVCQHKEAFHQQAVSTFNTEAAQLNRRRHFCQDCVRWLPASERAKLPWQVGTF